MGRAKAKKVVVSRRPPSPFHEQTESTSDATSLPQHYAAVPFFNADAFKLPGGLKAIAASDVDSQRRSIRPSQTIRHHSPGIQRHPSLCNSAQSLLPSVTQNLPIPRHRSSLVLAKESTMQHDEPVLPIRTYPMNQDFHDDLGSASSAKAMQSAGCNPAEERVRPGGLAIERSTNPDESGWGLVRRTSTTRRRSRSEMSRIDPEGLSSIVQTASHTFLNASTNNNDPPGNLNANFVTPKDESAVQEEISPVQSKSDAGVKHTTSRPNEFPSSLMYQVIERSQILDSVTDQADEMKYPSHRTSAMTRVVEGGEIHGIDVDSATDCDEEMKNLTLRSQSRRNSEMTGIIEGGQNHQGGNVDYATYCDDEMKPSTSRRPSRRNSVMYEVVEARQYHGVHVESVTECNENEKHPTSRLQRRDNSGMTGVIQGTHVDAPAVIGSQRRAKAPNAEQHRSQDSELSFDVTSIDSFEAEMPNSSQGTDSIHDYIEGFDKLSSETNQGVSVRESTSERLPFGANGECQLTSPRLHQCLIHSDEGSKSSSGQQGEDSEVSIVSLGSYGTTIIEDEEDFSTTCMFRRGSFSTISSHESVLKRGKQTESFPAYDDDSSSKSESKESLGSENANTLKFGIVGLIQSGIEQVFREEESSESDDDPYASYHKWLERSRRPRPVGDARGRVWTCLEAKDRVHGHNKAASTMQIVSLPIDFATRRVVAHQHDWSDSSLESSDGYFLNSQSRIRKELHALARLVVEQESSGVTDGNEVDEASVELDVFLKEEGITEDMIETLFEPDDRTAWRGKMTQDIAQAIIELDLAEIDFDDSSNQHERKDDDSSTNASDLRISLFALGKAKALFARKRQAQNTAEMNDDVSFLSISSSECEEAGKRAMEEDLQKDDARETLNEITDDCIVDQDDVKSLGSLADYGTAFNMMEEDYMDFDNYVKTSFKRKVAIADKSVVVGKRTRKEVRKPFLSGLLSSIRISKDIPGEGANETRKLLGSEKDVGLAEDDDGEGDDEESGYNFWKHKLPEERWDMTDKIDFYSALQVQWEAPDMVHSDHENPYIGLDESGRECTGSSSDHSQASTSEEFTLPVPMLDWAYKKVPKQRRPYVLFVLFVLVVVVPIAYGLSVAVSRSTASSIEELGVNTQSPTSSPTSAFTFQSWTQVGESLFSNDVRAQNGFSLSLSDDGSVLAIGARKSACPGYKDCGQVNLYEFTVFDGTSSWVLLQTLEGGINGNQFGFAVSISGNGRRLAVASVGDDQNGENSGLVQVFERRENSWDMLVEYHGQQEGELFGASVSLSKDGRMLAVGAPFHAANNTLRRGQVYFFEDIGFDSLPRWIQSRKPLAGSSTGDLFGWSLALSEDGSRLVVGSPADPTLNVNGYARVYEFVGFRDTWVQLGADLGYQEGHLDRFGYSVSISNSGSRVAIGAYASTTDNQTLGEVSVYQFADQYWDPLGLALVGDEESDGFGYSVALSPEGGHLAVGAPSHNGSGIVKVFEYDGRDGWLPSVDIVGGVNRAAFGFSVDLSSFAQHVAVGMPRASEVKVFSSQ